jgi:hypothetical protein
VNADVTLTGAVDDTRGLGVAVHQDHNGIRIDAGGIEITFEISSLQTFMRLLADAACDARLWEISQAAQLETMDAALSGITTGNLHLRRLSASSVMTMSDPVPAGMMRTRGGVRIAVRPRDDQSVAAVILGITIGLTPDESHQLRDLLHDAELRAARGDVIA